MNTEGIMTQIAVRPITNAELRELKDARWWTVRDVAEYRGVHPSTVRRWVGDAKKLRKTGEDGGIPFSQPRGTKYIRFKPEAVKRFFEDGEAY